MIPAWLPHETVEDYLASLLFWHCGFGCGRGWWGVEDVWS